MAQPKIITRLLARLLRPAVEDIQRLQAAEQPMPTIVFRNSIKAEADRLRASLWATSAAPEAACAPGERTAARAWEQQWTGASLVIGPRLAAAIADGSRAFVAGTFIACRIETIGQAAVHIELKRAEPAEPSAPQPDLAAWEAAWVAAEPGRASFIAEGGKPFPMNREEFLSWTAALGWNDDDWYGLGLYCTLLQPHLKKPSQSARGDAR